jgi:hypothetical protein
MKENRVGFVGDGTEGENLCVQSYRPLSRSPLFTAHDGVGLTFTHRFPRSTTNSNCSDADWCASRTSLADQERRDGVEFSVYHI